MNQEELDKKLKKQEILVKDEKVWSFTYEDHISSIVKEAEKKGSFDNLPGKGKPLNLDNDLSYNPEKFELGYQPVTPRDYRFEKMFSEEIDWEEIVDEENNTELGELYDDLCEDQGHKVGGYPFFTQTDPREWEEKYQQHNILLLQIDTDDSLNIMWGDSGVANFFIKKDDLLNLDFSNIIYNWDCY